MWAFDPRMGVRLRPVFSSDFTHFDVPDFRDVIPEAFEMVEKGFVTEQDFREFTFTNAARLHTRNNPDFFKGTVVEQAVADELGLKTPLAGSESLSSIYGCPLMRWLGGFRITQVHRSNESLKFILDPQLEVFFWDQALNASFRSGENY